MIQTSRVAELEGRLHRLESILGSSSDKLTRLSSATSKDTLLETAQYLSATASLLDSAQLDHIEGRLSCLQQKLDAIAEKKKEIAQDEQKDKMVCMKIYYSTYFSTRRNISRWNLSFFMSVKFFKCSLRDMRK